MPRKLSDLYQEIFEHIMSTQDETERTVADSILKWLLCAQEHMSYVDFITAITIKLDVSTEDINSDLILDLLNNFVVLDGDQGMKTFRFAHLSVREFLEKLPQYSITSSNAFVAEACLVALIGSSRCPSAAKFLQSQSLHFKSQEIVKEHSNMEGFEGYAFGYWIPHCCDAGELERSKYLKSILQFFLFHDSGEDSPLAVWVHSYQRKPPWKWNKHLDYLLKIYTSCLDRALLLACAYGFSEVISCAINDPKLSDKIQEVALHVVLDFNQYDVLKLLLHESNAHLEFTQDLFKYMLISRSSTTPISKTSTYRETLLWLLDRSKGAFATNDMLLYAKSVDDVELLWDRIAEPTISSESLERAVHSIELFRMLWGKAVKPVITERLLVQAFKRGSQDTVKFLLKVLTDRSLITHKVLCWAAHRGHSNVVEMLWNRSTEVKISEEMMQFAATCDDSKSPMMILLDHGGTPTSDVVLAAAANCKRSTLNSLIERGGTVTMSALRYGIANRKYSLKVSGLLLDHLDHELIAHHLDELLCFAAAVSQSRTGNVVGTLKKLLDRNKRSLIPKEVLLHAAVNTHCGNSVIKTLLDDEK